MRSLFLGAFVAFCLSSGAAAGQDGTPPTPSILTTGDATVRRAPDEAFVTVAVETRARSPRDAQRLNADAMTAVQQRLVDAGVAKTAVRTTGYFIQQEFDYASGRRTPRDYVARNGIEVHVDAVDRAGEILDLVVQAGATSVTGVRFDIKDRAAAEREALRLAVVDARARADAMAAGAGRVVDRILRIEDGPAQMRVPMLRAEFQTAVGAGDRPPTPIEVGVVEIRAQVTLTVAIK